MVGSRVVILERNATWIEDAGSHILWLRGGAGMGKSTIAHQIVYSLTDSGRLATYFFFTGGSSDQTDPVAVIKTMARELSSLHPITTAEVARAIRAPQSSHQSLSRYLEQYLSSPIRTILTPRSIVIVLDALNEWVNHSPFLEALKENTQLLSGMKFIITSRPEKRIADALAELSVTTIVLDKVDMPIMKEYFTQRFKDILWYHRRPSDRELERLATAADGLLIWAATVCEYISNDMEEEPHRLLEQILTTTSGVSSEKRLTTLYQTTLTRMFGDGPGKDADHFRRLFGAISVIQESVKVSDFDLLMNTKSVRLLENVLSRLSSLQTRGDDICDITPATHRFHISFVDFLTSQEAPSHLRISTSQAHSTMAEACLRTLSQFFENRKGSTKDDETCSLCSGKLGVSFLKCWAECPAKR
jgi:archaellum biogenesis ATPase FlaH